MPSDNEKFTLEWVSGVNDRREPFVQLAKVYSKTGKRQIIAQLSPAQASDCALNALIAAEAAQSDALLYRFLTDKVNVGPQALGPIMLEFRNMRAELFGTSTPADISHWNAVMDDLAEQNTGKPFDPTKKQ